MPPKIALTPEKKARLKRDVLDGIGSTASVKSGLVKKDVSEIKKTLRSSSLPKDVPIVIPKKNLKRKTVKSPIANKVFVGTVKKSKPSTRKISKPEKTDVMVSDDFSYKEHKQEIKPKVSPLIAKLRQSNLNKRTESQESVDNFFAKPEESKVKKGFGFYFVRVLAFLVLLIVLVFCVDIYGIYRLGWSDGFSYQIAHILPLPAAQVNGKSIRLSDYLDDVSVLQTALANQREGLSDQIISPDNKESVIDRLVLISLINEQLSKYGKVVSEQDLNANLDSIIQQFNGKTEAEQNVKKLYGINLNQFKVKVLKPLLSKNLLQSLIVNDDNLDINKNAKAKAQLVLDLALKPGANFAELAKQYTEDEAGINTGGDLGFISRGEATEEIEKILFSLPANTVYDKIVTNSVGYHIIMVENKLNDPQTGKESVRAKQIFVKVDVDKYLKDLMANSKIVKYVK